MLAHVDSNSSGRDIAKAVGESHVRYGMKTGWNAKLGFGDPASVCDPPKGMRFED